MVVRVIELVGSSERSFTDAVRRAVRPASGCLPGIVGVEVVSATADVGGEGGVSLFKVTCRVAYEGEGGGLPRTPSASSSGGRPRHD
ncbi:MAG TPA: dodecin family protein [Actinomycetota bacterium]|nr:dodecin family protein [Actinomycetota bacterium]